MALYDPIDNEAHDEALADLARECADTITQALAAGLPKTTILIDEALGEFMQDDHARAELLKKTAAGGNAFAEVIKDLIWNEALKRAEKELERQAKDAADDAAYGRVESVIVHREPWSRRRYP